MSAYVETIIAKNRQLYCKWRLTSVGITSADYGPCRVWRLGCNGAPSTRPASRPGKGRYLRTAGLRWSRYGRGPRPACGSPAFRPRGSPWASPRRARSAGRHCPACRGSRSSVACHFRPTRDPTQESSRRRRIDARQPGARGGYRRRRTRHADRRREPMTLPSASRAPAAYPGRMVFPPWRRRRCCWPERPGLGEIAGPLRAPLMSASREVV